MSFKKTKIFQTHFAASFGESILPQAFCYAREEIHDVVFF